MKIKCIKEKDALASKSQVFESKGLVLSRELRHTEKEVKNAG
jgi:hypothetical protein